MSDFNNPKMVSLIIMIPVLTSALNSLFCLDIKCASESETKCIDATDEEIIIQQCKSGYICEDYSQLHEYSETWEDSLCLTNNVSEKDLCNTGTYDNTVKTGFYCCKSSNCLSGICDGNRCTGYPKGRECDSDEVCLANYYCHGLTTTNDGVCSEIIQKDQCAKDFDCPEGHGCNYGKCIQLFSLDYNTKVSDKKFCISDFATTDYCDAVSVWSQNVQLTSPFKCQIGYMCQYKSLIYETVIDQQLCLCSGGGNEFGYCGLHMEKVKSHAEDLFKNLRYDESYCAGSNARTDDIDIVYNCGGISEDKFEEYSELSLKYKYWTLYNSGAIDKCAENLELFAESYGEFIAITAVLLAVYH